MPDKDRDEARAQQRAELIQRWQSQQATVKAEKLEVTYSYWDGTGHRRAVTITKGTTIGRFLEQVRRALAKEFPEIRSLTADALIYVKEDLIIPHHLSFYDLIIGKARGKSGPLFRFDVHDDLRLAADATVEKEDSHPGKVVERRWYERNKHIFPASRWEVFDPAQQHDEPYTVKGK